MNTEQTQYGLSTTTIKQINAIFSANPEIEKVKIYGSRAKGNYHKGSDIDLSIVGGTLTSSQLAKIETDLDDLLLPYKIDLSELSKIDNEDLIDHIERIGKIFYEKY
jgi:predicted nucleotidyltransferase